MLRQQARVLWLKEGDRNSRFFHQVIQKRRAKNSIKRLKWKGKITSDPKEIKKAIFEHIRDCFASRNFDKIFQVLHVVPKKISDEDNELLIKPPSKEEVELALWDCNSDKAPGPDGMNAGVLKYLWNSILNEMFESVLNFFRNGSLLGGMTSSFITLIPKIKHPLEVKDFRPISLINCSLNVSSKLITNRLALVMDKVISPNQSGFIKRKKNYRRYTDYK